MPEATHLTIRFASGGEQRFASNVPDDWHTPEVLDELFALAEAR